MPIIRYKQNIFHFAHIPKCGGSSFLAYINQINGVRIGFYDVNFSLNRNNETWCKTSPQHISSTSLSKLFLRDFFDYFLVVTRDPMQKIISGYKFQRFHEGRIDPSLKLDLFIKGDLLKNYSVEGWLDNHFYPQVGFLYPGAPYKVFKIELDGIKNMIQYFESYVDGPVNSLNVPHLNMSDPSLDNFESEFYISPEATKIIHEIYNEDFQLFNY